VRIHFRSLIVALVATAACKGTEPLLPAPTTITISPAAVLFGSVNSTRQLTAQVLDQHGDPFPGAQVTWSTGNAAVATVSAAGVVTSAGGGSTQITATVGHASSSITVNVTQVPASIAKSAGDGQTGLVNFAVNIPPAVIVRDSGGVPIAGVQVTFNVTGGGGGVTGGTPLTGANGVASFGATGVAGTYNIEIRPLTTISAARLAVFDSAAARWGRLIYGDVPDVPLNVGPGTCTSRAPAINETIDDIVIFAILDSIDGPGQILGQAGPCWIRSLGFQTIVGVMFFDTADVATYEGRNQFDEIVMHEMGHVLGFGTIWGSSYLNLLVGPASQGGTDPHFVGPQAVAAFNQIGGTGYTAGAKVPVENTGGAGTRDSHWRESVFGDELMTGFLGAPGSKPLSLVTVGSMGDEGYQVNYAGAEAFSLTFPAAALRAQAPGIELKDDILKLPIRIVNRQGQLMRVVMPQ